MKKRNIIILMSLFVFALMITLTSCGDDYAGNYVEVTEKEELVNTKQKVINLVKEVETKDINYVTTINSYIKMKMLDGYEITGKLNVEKLEDVKNKLVYAETKISSTYDSEDGGSIVISARTWLNPKQGEYSYINYSMKGMSQKEKIDINKKYKTYTLSEENLLSRTEIGNYLSMFDSLDDDINLYTMINAFNQDGSKLYVDNNKIKVEFNYDGLKAIIYLIINDNNKYQLKLVIPGNNNEVNSNLNVSLEVELKMTSDEVKLPDGKDYKEM